MRRSANRSIGILREVKSKWERRVALAPTEVRKLVDRNIKVRIQPCERRIFKDIEYENAGATIAEDLSGSNCIIGVEETAAENLLPNHSYLVFSRVIKAQSKNMRFLDTCLNNNIRLYDYECIREPPSLESKFTVATPRLVTFGEFAGLAGMITGFRGLGEHLLASGAATPFSNISSAYMYDSLDRAKDAVRSAGELITHSGLPTRFGPFTFVFTGGGHVTKGALDVLSLLPHEIVEPQQLPGLQRDFSPHKVYGCVLPLSSLVAPVDGRQYDSTFEFEQHYFEHPEAFCPTFHEIAPYALVLVNGIYWDHRYPRLLTIEQTAELKANHPSCLQALFDITCDVNGSVQFFKKATSTDHPFFMYNPLLDEISDELAGEGILVLGVDTLSAELPRESSNYFSKTVFPFAEALATIDSSPTLENLYHNLPPELYYACITSNNKLTPNFNYIHTLRTKKVSGSTSSLSSSFGVQRAASQTVLRIEGHLFDSGLINQIFDLIEQNKGEYQIDELNSRVNTPGLTRASRLIIEITAHHDKLPVIVTKLRNLCELVAKAQATLTQLPFGAAKKHKPSPDKQEHEPVHAKKMKPTLKKIIANAKRSGKQHRILVLGSGFVSQPVVDYLCYSGNNFLTVASNDFAASTHLCQHHPFATPAEINANDYAQVNAIVKSHDIVVSLLPATMHIPIAKACIRHGKDLATTSYISPTMQELNWEARRAGVTLLNETGLDPGLDHMSALKIIRGIQNNSWHEQIVSFESVCGGLPAPECANNMLGYKFSWSPMGVLNATVNNSIYLRESEFYKIDGQELLNKFRPLYPNPYPSLAFEQLPNRNALSYIEHYGLNPLQLQTMYRGTLRYSGFSELLSGCKMIGLMDTEEFANHENEQWCDYLNRQVDAKYKYGNDSDNNETLQTKIEKMFVENTNWTDSQIYRFCDLLHWLNMLDNTKENIIFQKFNTPIEVFCDLLSKRLNYEEDERDMVVMYHRIGTNAKKVYESSLLVYGDDEYSAMSRTVGFPVAIATQWLLNEKPNMSEHVSGVISGGNVHISDYILNECRQYGIKFSDEINVLYEKKPLRIVQ